MAGSQAFPSSERQKEGFCSTALRQHLPEARVVNVMHYDWVSDPYSRGTCDIESGRKQFSKCVACHSVEPGEQLMGPSLYGLMGRQVGSVEGFPFSAAMEAADFVWTEESLDSFLESPAQVVPGSVMPFGGIRKEDQRRALICYIRQLGE